MKVQAKWILTPFSASPWLYDVNLGSLPVTLMRHQKDLLLVETVGSASSVILHASEDVFSAQLIFLLN